MALSPHKKSEKNIPIREAAERSGYSTGYLSYLCRTGKIIGTYSHSGWSVDYASLEGFMTGQAERKEARARALASAREQEYKAHRSARTPVDGNLHVRPAGLSTSSLNARSQFSIFNFQKKLSAPLPMPESLEHFGNALRPHALALSVAFAVVAGSALVAHAEVIPKLATNTGVLVEEFSFGFRESFGDIPARVVAEFGTTRDAMRAQPARVAAKNAALTASIASRDLSQPNLAYLRLDTRAARAPQVARVNATRRASAEGALLQSDSAPLITPSDLAKFASHVLSSVSSPRTMRDALAGGYRALGMRAYAGIETLLAGYRARIDRAGAGVLAFAAATRDTLARSPSFVHAVNLALGEAVISATHAAIRADVSLAYHTADAAPASARAVSLAIGTAGDRLARLASAAPRAATGAFLAATAVPAYVAPAIAQAVSDAEYRVALPFARLLDRVEQGYVALIEDASSIAYDGGQRIFKADASVGSPTDKVASGFSIPEFSNLTNAVQDAYLGTLGKTALVLEGQTFQKFNTAIVSVVQNPQIAAALAALSPVEQAALATYEALRNAAIRTRTALAYLFGPAPDSQIAIVSNPSSSTLPFDASKLVQSSPVLAPLPPSVSNFQPSISNSYPTYSTVVQGITQDDMSRSLTAMRDGILGTVAGMIQPVSRQVVTNAATTQSVNMIQDLHDLIVRNGDFRNSIFDNGIRVSATGGNFTNLVGGTVTISGSLGIGTSTPASIVDIYGTDALHIPVGTNLERPAMALTGQIRYNTDKHQFEGFGDSAVWEGLGGVIDTDQDTYITADTGNIDEDTLRLFTAGTERLTITNTGLFGFGTTTPLSRLTVSGGASIGANYNIAAPTNGLIVEGNVGIGTTSPSAALAVSGNFFLTGSTTVTGAGAGITFSGTGNHDITALGGTLRIGSNTIIGNIQALDDTVDIGTAATRFDKIYANEVNASTIVGTLTGGNLTAETFSINSDNATADAENAYLSFERGSVSPNALLTWNSAGSAKRFELNHPLFIQDASASTTNTTLSLQSVAGQTGDVFRVASSSGDYLLNFSATGNLGLGTTSPYAKLSVVGPIIAEYFHATSTTATSTFAGGFSAGLCVTGDTKLRRRRKAKEGESEADEDGYIYDEVAIKDIKEGDEIQSLDEKTGALVWRRVKQLAFMGVKQTYRLTTASGKTIRTTGNHPYLARRGTMNVPGGEGNIGSAHSDIPGVGGKLREKENSRRFKTFVATGTASLPAHGNATDNVSGLSRVVALIDFANIRAGYSDRGYRTIDLKVLYDTLTAAGISTIHFYYGTDERNEKQVGFFAKIVSFGYTFISKPVQYFKISLLGLLEKPMNQRWLKTLPLQMQESLIQEAEKLDRAGIRLLEPKANFDVEIATDALKMAETNDHFVLFSGDGDFVPLVNRLRELGKGVTVVSDRKYLSGELLLAADKFVTLGLLDTFVPGLLISNDDATQNPPRGRVLKKVNASIADLLGLSSASRGAVDNVRAGEGAWLKVSELKEGMEIASADEDARAVWEKIISVEPVAEEDVYDVEIEGTHNFIGNDIVAHNTAFVVNQGAPASSLYVAPSGNVGIGTTSPSGKLDIYGTVGAMLDVTSSNTSGTWLRLKNTDTGGNNWYLISSGTGNTEGAGHLIFYDGSNNRMMINSSGNVGIGTSTPVGRFAVLSADNTLATNIGEFRANNVTQGIGISYTGIRKLTTTGFNDLYIDGASGTTGNVILNASTGGSTGNVGIGTTSPFSRLSVTGAGTGTGRGFSVADSSNVDNFYVLDNGNTYMKGNVGIGTESPAAKLDIRPANEAGNNLRIYRGISAGYQLDYMIIENVAAVNRFTAANAVGGGNVNEMAFNVAGADRIFIKNDGNVGIGTTTPWGQLSVNPNGITGPAFVIGSSTATNFIVTNGGNVGIGTAGPVSPLDVLAGSGDGTTNEAFGIRLRSNAVTGNTQTLNIGVNSPPTTGEGYAYIQSAHWGSGYANSVLALNPKGAAVSIGEAGNSAANSVIFDVNGNTRIHNTSTTVGELGGRLGFAGGYSGSNAWIAGIYDQAQAYYGMGLVFATLGGSTDVNGGLGVERMRISGAGNVGIGTAAPISKLDISSGAASTTASETSTLRLRTSELDANNPFDLKISMAGGAAIGNRYALFQTSNHNSANGGNIVFQEYGGNVGIGTTNPGSNLEVNAGGADLTKNILTVKGGGSSGNYGFLVEANNGDDILKVDTLTYNVLINPSSGSGNVGIGTTTPDSLLTLNAAGSAVLRFASAAADANARDWRMASNLHAYGDFAVQQSTTRAGNSWDSKIVIGSTGNVGIGTTNPTGGKLDVYDDGDSVAAHFKQNSVNGYGMVINAGGTASGRYGMVIRNGADNIDYFRVLSETGKEGETYIKGNVGIGTTTPATTLSVYNGSESATLTNFTQALTSGGMNVVSDFTDDTYAPGLFWSTQNNQSSKPKAGIWTFNDANFGTKLFFGTSNDYATGITNTALVINEAGNVGIGTTSPASKLAVSGGASIGANYNTAAPTNGLIVEGTTRIGTTDGTLVQNGQIGGGNDLNKLKVIGNAAAKTSIALGAPDDNSGVALVLFNSGSNAVRAEIGQDFRSSQGSPLYMQNFVGGGSIGFYTTPAAGSVTERVRVDSNGNVGVGSTTPWGQLSVNPNGITGPAFVVGSSTATNFIVTNGGNVGIGTSNPSQRLTVAGGQILVGPADNTNSYVNFYSTSYKIGASSGLELYTGANDVIRFINGTTEKARFNENGSFGIGTTSPWGLLSVNANAIGSAPQFVVGSSTATNFIVTNGGNVGIGVANPTVSLNIGGNFTMGTNDGGGSATFVANGNRLTVAGDGNHDFVGLSTGQFVINRPASGSGSIDLGGNLNNSNRLNVTGNSYFNGNVGIGTASPSEKLTISAGNILLIGDQQLKHTYGNLAGLSGGVSKLGNLANETNLEGNIILINAGANRHFRSVAGLDVNDNGGETGVIYDIEATINRTDISYTGFKFNVTEISAASSGNQVFDWRVGNVSKFMMSNGGNVGIGTTSPATLLEVGGSTANVTFDGYKNCTGFTSNGNGLLACTASDQRLKQDVVALDGASVLVAINALNPVSFYWQSGADRGSLQQYGLIAQEVQSVFPNLVVTSSPSALTPDGTLSVNYEGLISPMILAIQELDARTRQILGSDGVLSIVPGVESQCVTGDTKLRRRRRRSDGSFEFDEIAIADVAEGDEIQSLDERTGQVVYSRVNALIDMGTQEVFELTTASGRKIRTTGNHPFLARLAPKAQENLGTGT